MDDNTQGNETQINDDPPETQDTPNEGTGTPTAPELPPKGDMGEPVEETLAEKIQKKSRILDKGEAKPDEEGEDKEKKVKVTPELPPYQPNFKIKVLDKEIEIDPMFRALMKDQASEKKVRELFEKAYGLDHVKGERQKIREEAQQVRQKLEETTGAVNQILSMKNKKDYHSFFKALQISEEDILKYALERVQYREMSPDERAVYDQRYSAQEQALTLEQQNQALAREYETTAQRARQMELDYELQNPQVQQAVEAFDQRAGQPGAFLDEVINRGLFHWNSRHVDVPAKEVIQEVIKLYGLAQAQPPATQTPENLPPQHAAGASPAPVTTQPKPVIPTMRGTGTSPVKKVPARISDLRKMAEQMSD